MSAKIQLKNEKTGTFGGIFLTLDFFDQFGLTKLIDNELKSRGLKSKYSYSDIVKNLSAIFLCGGDVIEDINMFRNDVFAVNPAYRFCSADTILRSFSELAVDNINVVSESGIKYAFNVNDTLNSLLIKCLLKCQLLGDLDDLVLDYDNQLIETDKYDARYSYKGKNGYFPGIAQINNHPAYIENRDGNANVKTDQAETLERMFGHFIENNIRIKKVRLDCGSYAKNIVEVIDADDRIFYVRAQQCASLHKRFEEELSSEDWKDVEINYHRCQLASLPFTSFLSHKGYRLVVQRTLIKDEQSTLFDSYIYRSILTNDTISSEEEIVRFYNQRGCSEQTFDVMNNDFGWSHLPCSFMMQNVVFMIFTAIIKNFYTTLMLKLSQKDNFQRAFALTATSRLKRFIFRIVQVPFKWVHGSKEWVLQLFTTRPYNILQT